MTSIVLNNCWEKVEDLDNDQVLVEPRWLLPHGFEIPYSAYRTVLDTLGNWKPARRLSFAEVWKCVWCGYPDDHVPWDREKLIDLIDQGYFRLSDKVKRVHDATKLARRIYAHDWPSESEDLLTLWFHRENQSWLWVKPGSVFANHAGFASTYISKDEFTESLLLSRIINPDQPA